MERFGHHRLKTFGVGQELAPKQWHSVFRQLLAAGCLDTDLAAKSGLRLNERSRDILTGKQPVFFRKDPDPVKPTSRKQSSAKTSFEWEDADSIALWEALRQLRLELSKELKIPPYVIFHDKTLKAMVIQRPMARDDLLGIPGVGHNKMERFGDLFLKVIAQSAGGTARPAGD
jgi:ATP-dependent DNA helicase RecQ